MADPIPKSMGATWNDQKVAWYAGSLKGLQKVLGLPDWNCLIGVPVQKQEGRQALSDMIQGRNITEERQGLGSRLLGAIEQLL